MPKLDFYCCDKNHDQKELGEETYRFDLKVMGKAKAGTQGRKLEAGTRVETVEKFCLLASSQRLAKSTFLCNPGPPAQG